ncbi:RES domain-containing protein [Marinobacter sp. LV10R510-11A]|uniref:RES family NAD+ phosphorylase n=1 Tax=Marinobacter sp. LV10R510-11A TaxID=1415568 RepID=UPI000BB6ABA0|nr:RES family NAD+ phosphorylase [Marinobacter sp. LV10R510-11A]SOB76036.1 RES domain-containing protein [Marinobacter sp. LV10R510-11A]
MALDLPAISLSKTKGFRLINSKLPTIDIFNDVADPDEFQDLYDLQAMTNPRLNQEVGNLNYIDLGEIPWGIPGCHYAAASFTHVAPGGSRFSNGEFGVLYIADTMETALAEVEYHQGKYLANVEDLKFDRLIFRGLACTFSGDVMHDATELAAEHEIYHPDDYTAARALGARLRVAGSEGVHYWSVRNSGAICWGLFTPRNIQSIVQTGHYEFIVRGGDIMDRRKVVGV